MSLWLIHRISFGPVIGQSAYAFVLVHNRMELLHQGFDTAGEQSSSGRTIVAKESGGSRCPTPSESRQATGGV
jgi:hypothetical protein